MDAARLEHIRTWQHRYVDQRKYAGSSLLINRNGEEHYFHAAGQRNIAENLPFTRDTVTRIYSMTKPVTSLALMMLLERGLLHLDMPVSEFLPEFNGMRCLINGAADIAQTRPCRPPTLHELLTHTSGLSYPFNPGILPEDMSKTDLMFKPSQGPLAAQVLELAALPLAFEPGQRWEYSVGIDVIGRVIEVVTGESLGTMLKREIFDPLGMDRTGFRSLETTGNLLASLYSPLSGDAMALNDAQQGADSLRLIDSYDDTPFDTAEMHSGGGGLLSTIDDYMRFAELIRLRGSLGKDHLISPQIVDFMCQNHLPGDIASMGPQSFAEQPMDGMGFGLGGAVVLDPARARCPGSVGDFSWGGMASTFFWVDPVLDVSVVFFTQLAPSSSYPSRAELKALVHGAVTR
ncbi:serine hydrolase domain-containing protein [Phaeobacter gallaeciensis]|uniref:Beta-lactamase n=1 Tax=Phaeobacter gallaeciensis TaxID=60890 RepID=A0AAD0ECW5_9RHOB|nr:serine hydrolase domain-containing protein [Phaeobacter gallaeciensis]AHD09588.1 Beta-lactamase class C and other penicillin binding protein [Phaeobacter gallaeciensis DSM 26640]ATE92853.1 putative beta-lactamase [Phaeobacter gallaeciensis]ATE97325.1 putative beta-lactamase [Phaeobacter gallaeciensis]ATF01518.1 putative beta-lactamase [Phaeobacter gallaeciensis]ATF05898.1 putative beta-lactamase [Phaeobacter gallaeciensis]